jgi:hypothetical protein
MPEEQESYQPVGGQEGPPPQAEHNLPEANPLEAQQEVPAPGSQAQPESAPADQGSTESVSDSTPSSPAEGASEPTEGV